MAEEKDFLARWSERKRAVASQAQADDPELAPGEPSTSEGGAAEEIEEAEANRIAAESIDLDSLDFRSDYSVFFKNGVPKALQAEARRRLWRSSPVLANVDGLNDYDEDFASPNLILKAFKSTYEIGKGYFQRPVEEVAAVPAGESEDVDVAEANSINDGATDIGASGDHTGEAADETPPAETAVAHRPAPEIDEAGEVTPHVSLRDRLGLSSGEGEA